MRLSCRSDQTTDRLPNRLSVNEDCIKQFNELKLGRGGPKYVIYKISDDQKEIVVDEVGKETDYEVFREKLISKKEKNGKDRPSYAVYDLEFELQNGEGKRSKIIFFTYINQDGTGVKVSSTLGEVGRAKTNAV